MPNIFNHGHKDRLQRGWLVLHAKLSSSKHSTRPAVAVVRCCGDRNAFTKQPLFDDHPQGGLQHREILLPTLKALLHRCLRSPGQSPTYHRYKSEQKHRTAFVAVAQGRHDGGKVSITIYPSKQIKSLRLGRSRGVTIRRATKPARRNFAEDRLSSVTALSTTRKDTRLIPSSLEIRRAGDGTRRRAPFSKGETKLKQRRLKKLWKTSRSQISPSAYQLVRVIPDTVGNRKATPSDEAGSTSQTTCLLTIRVSVRRSSRSSSRNVLVKIQFMSPSGTRVSDPIQWYTTSFPMVSTRKVPMHPAGRIATLAITKSSRSVVSSRSIWPRTAAQLLQLLRRLRRHRLYTVHPETAASSRTEFASIVQCTQSQEFMSTLSATPMFSNEYGSSTEV